MSQMPVPVLVYETDRDRLFAAWMQFSVEGEVDRTETATEAFTRVSIGLLMEERTRVLADHRELLAALRLIEYIGDGASNIKSLQRMAQIARVAIAKSTKGIA